MGHIVKGTLVSQRLDVKETAKVKGKYIVTSINDTEADANGRIVIDYTTAVNKSDDYKLNKSDVLATTKATHDLFGISFKRGDAVPNGNISENGNLNDLHGGNLWGTWFFSLSDAKALVSRGFPEDNVSGNLFVLRGGNNTIQLYYPNIGNYIWKRSSRHPYPTAGWTVWEKIGGVDAIEDLAGQLKNKVDKTQISHDYKENKTDKVASTKATAELYQNTFKLGGLLDDKINLNDLKFKTRDYKNNPNVYYQTSNAKAKPELAYPIEKAGTLMLLPSAYWGQQLYIPYMSNEIYKRDSAWKDEDESQGVWNDWVKVSTNEKVDYASCPIGVPIPYPSNKIPEGYLLCNGQTFDKTKYPLLAEVYPTGKLPDLRGEFIRGWDNARGVDKDRVLLSSQSDLFKEHLHPIDITSQDGGGASKGTVTTEPAGEHTHTLKGNTKDKLDIVGSLNNGLVGRWSSDGKQFDDGTAQLIAGVEAHTHKVNINTAPHTHKVTGNTANTGSTETRPRNIAFNYIVRAVNIAGQATITNITDRLDLNDSNTSLSAKAGKNLQDKKIDKGEFGLGGSAVWINNDIDVIQVMTNAKTSFFASGSRAVNTPDGGGGKAFDYLNIIHTPTSYNTIIAIDDKGALYTAKIKEGKHQLEEGWKRHASVKELKEQDPRQWGVGDPVNIAVGTDLNDMLLPGFYTWWNVRVKNSPLGYTFGFLNVYMWGNAGTNGGIWQICGESKLGGHLYYRWKNNFTEEFSEWGKIYSSTNTSIDPNGFLRASGDKVTLTTSNLVQTTGVTTQNIMSQKSVTDELNKKVNLTGGDLTGTLKFNHANNTLYDSEHISFAPSGSKNYLRKMRGGLTNSIWHETVQGDIYTLSTGDTDSKEIFKLSRFAGAYVLGNKVVTEDRIVKDVGDSDTNVMSQKASTDELNKKVNLDGSNIMTGRLENTARGEAIRLSNTTHSHIDFYNEENGTKRTGWVGKPSENENTISICKDGGARLDVGLGSISINSTVSVSKNKDKHREIIIKEEGSNAILSVKLAATPSLVVRKPDNETYYNITIPYTSGAMAIEGSTPSFVDVKITSDQRAKTDITPISNALEKIQGLNGSMFTYKETNERSGGIIAQDLLKVLPDGVDQSDPEQLKVHYNAVIGLLVEAVKELKEENSNITTKLDILLSTIEK